MLNSNSELEISLQAVSPTLPTVAAKHEGRIIAGSGGSASTVGLGRSGVHLKCAVTAVQGRLQASPRCTDALIDLGRHVQSVRSAT
jgi:hypothetical protein